MTNKKKKCIFLTIESKRLEASLKFIKKTEIAHIVCKMHSQEEWEAFTGVCDKSNKELKEHIQKYFSNLPYQFAIKRKRILHYKVVCPLSKKCKHHTESCEARRYTKYTFPTLNIKLKGRNND